MENSKKNNKVVDKMKKVFKAVITYNVIGSHPDIKGIKNPDEKQKFEDTYTLDSDYFNDTEKMIDYIKQDLSLVAGGGYNTDHIYGISFDIEKISTITK